MPPTAAPIRPPARLSPSPAARTPAPAPAREPSTAPWVVRSPGSVSHASVPIRPSAAQAAAAGRRRDAIESIRLPPVRPHGGLGLRGVAERTRRFGWDATNGAPFASAAATCARSGPPLPVWEAPLLAGLSEKGEGRVSPEALPSVPRSVPRR